MTVISDSWLKVARFKAQLLKSGNPHNFTDTDPEFAFETVGANILVTRANTTSTIYDGSGSTPVPRNSTIPSLGVKVNTRQLAGYWFSGTGDWSEAARWNNVTTENINTLPGNTDNAIIAGNATVSDARTVNQLTVAEGGYLVLNEAAELTTTDLYNDNQSAGKSRAETIAAWDFEDTGQAGLPYLADDGIVGNNGVSEFNTSSNFDQFYIQSQHYIPGWTRAPFAYPWATGFGGASKKDWNISFSTQGYENVKLSSKQWSDLNGDLGQGAGPDQFKLQFSLDGTAWTDIGSPYNVGNDGSIGNLTDIVLPTDINNKTSVFIRWINTTTGKNGYSGIEDIIITGEEIPPPPTGILIQSTASATGSLIHSNTGVEATVQRYINRWSAKEKGIEHGWHFLSSPVATQAIRPEFVPSTNPIPDYIDFFKWDESWVEGDDVGWWINVKDASNNWNADFEDNLVPGRGYLLSYGTPPPKDEYGDKAHIFAGTLNVDDVTKTGLSRTPGSTYPGWHLVGNPFSSAIDLDQGSWTKTNIAAVPQIWSESNASYKVISGEGIIPAHNGFMIYTSGNGTLKIPADARVHSDSSWYKGDNPDQIMLVANDMDRNTKQETVIRFNAEASVDFDMEYDALFIAGFAPMLYSVSNSKLYALNTLPETSSELTIPLGFVKNESGNFNISLEQSIDSETIYLTDLKLNKSQNMSSNPVYSFESLSGDNPDRFLLSFDVVSVNEMQESGLSAWFNYNSLFIRSQYEKTHIEMYDVMGIKRYDKVLCDSGLQVLQMNQPAGFYILHITGGSEQATLKIYIN